ncbi:hypothetical protein JCGZ_23662 [Jatropha curcas]|uniref:Uncharacterized protein n=1 Tax=Jatropha curcas TaxID=180498 RepID=A0A067L2W1_JATCU|nr:hypothetical protein JCGZ_23662 [Jatropha curcas]
MARSGACQALEVWMSQHGLRCLARSGEVPEHGRARLWKSGTYVARACFSCTGQVFISNAGTGVRFSTGWGVRASGSPVQVRARACALARAGACAPLTLCLFYLVFSTGMLMSTI